VSLKGLGAKAITASRKVTLTNSELNSVVKWWPAWNGVSTEAEESPLLEAVTGKRLVKTLQAALVICKM
jgi:hypothetical protein